MSSRKKTGLESLSKEEIEKLRQRFPQGFIDKHLESAFPSQKREMDLESAQVIGTHMVMNEMIGKHLVITKDGLLETSMTAQDYEEQVLQPLRSFNAHKIKKQLDHKQAKQEMLEYVAFNILMRFAPKDAKEEIKTLFGLF